MRKLGIWLCTLLIAVVSGPMALEARAAQGMEVSIPVSVLAEGSEPDRNAVYTVELTAKTSGAPMPEGSTGGVYQVNLKADTAGLFRIPCDRLGVFDYSIRQIPGGDENCTYDMEYFLLRVFVTVDTDGKLTASAVIYGQEGTKEPAILLHNRWADPVYVTFSAIKTLDGNTPQDGEFSFRLISESGEILFETKNNGRNVTFPALRFDRVGSYRYFLKETVGTGGKIIYDKAVYTITVEVTKDPDYHAWISYERNGKPFSGTPYFANYTDTGTPKTGDTIAIYAMMLGLSATGLGLALLFKRKKP